ncbi:hypothetical protein LOAG_14425 [Loa loa]|uniref:Uncharacterized protein n=1 Tax=Loa loa TaxID=7209 RepID=A0A1S0THW3_LOALO|nr:hypothetical protein LOAG_14425 [Loa loa]EFO14100.1 hypothetical protein LOAG_14425 [Loa loa]
MDIAIKHREMFIAKIYIVYRSIPMTEEIIENTSHNYFLLSYLVQGRLQLSRSIAIVWLKIQIKHFIAQRMDTGDSSKKKGKNGELLAKNENTAENKQQIREYFEKRKIFTPS